MTMALCLTCGNVKFGAICPCPWCGVASTGDISLDIAFSDHQLDVKTLEELGAVVHAIRQACVARGAAPEVQFWSFITYVSTHHPSILKANAPAAVAPQADDVLARTALPPVTPRPSRVHGAPRHSGGNNRSGVGRRWWQFWRPGAS